MLAARQHYRPVPTSGSHNDSQPSTGQNWWEQASSMHFAAGQSVVAPELSLAEVATAPTFVQEMSSVFAPGKLVSPQDTLPEWDPKVVNTGSDGESASSSLTSSSLRKCLVL
ncbi:unnamed protein product, partial [Polarella glacialis]